jgi:hypothetical protein
VRTQLDDLVLSWQHAVDRAIRRFRRGPRPEPAQRRFLIVQIDGLSRAVLADALAKGRMPFSAAPADQPGQPAFGNIPTRGGKYREEVSASRA